jgi:hypothetical protein
VILLPRWCIIHLLKKAFLVIGCGTGGIYWEGAKETSYLVMHSTGTTIKKCHVSCVTFKSHTGHVSAVLVYIYLVWNQVHLPWTHKLLYKILRYTNFSRKCAQSTLKQENIVWFTTLPMSEYTDCDITLGIWVASTSVSIYICFCHIWSVLKATTSSCLLVSHSQALSHSNTYNFITSITNIVYFYS